MSATGWSIDTSNLLVEEAFAFEDLGHGFLDPGGAGFGLFGGGDVVDVGALAAGG